MNVQSSIPTRPIRSAPNRFQTHWRWSQDLKTFTKMLFSLRTKLFDTWTPSLYKAGLARYAIPMINIRRSRDRLIFSMGIPILVGDIFILRRPPGSISYLWLIKVLGNQRSRYIYKVFSHWLRPYSAIDTKGTMFSVTAHYWMPPMDTITWRRGPSTPLNTPFHGRMLYGSVGDSRHSQSNIWIFDQYHRYTELKPCHCVTSKYLIT